MYPLYSIWRIYDIFRDLIGTFMPTACFVRNEMHKGTESRDGLGTIRRIVPECPSSYSSCNRIANESICDVH